MPFDHNETLDPELLKELGVLVVRHSALEEVLRDAISAATKVDTLTVHVLMAGLSCSTLIDKFGAVYYEGYPESRESIRALCAHLRTLNDKRNELIHSFWSVATDTKQMKRLRVSARAKSGLEWRGEEVTALKVRELTDAIGSAEDKVWEIICDLALPRPDQLSAG